MAEAKTSKKVNEKNKKATKDTELIVPEKPAKEAKDGTTTKSDKTAVQADRKDTEEVVAKAGKHSAKALKEAEEKLAKEKRKAEATTDEKSTEKPKIAQKTARPRLERQGKKFRKAAEQIEKDKQYSLQEALVLATKTSPVKFDATVEMHTNLNVDPRQAEQNVRETVVLPAGTGKTLRIAALTDDPAAAKKAGADKAGNDDLFAEIEKGVLDFDVLIATPAMMPKLGKYARVLGPKGLMPSPKSGTVSADVAKAIQDAKAGKVEYRVDSTGIIHLGIGKVSFGPEKLEENARAFLSSLKSAKPATLKGIYIQSITIATTMGPGIRIATSDI